MEKVDIAYQATLEILKVLDKYNLPYGEAEIVFKIILSEYPGKKSEVKE